MHLVCKLIPKREGRKGAELPIVKQSSSLDRVGEQSKIVFSYCLCKADELCQMLIGMFLMLGGSTLRKLFVLPEQQGSGAID